MRSLVMGSNPSARQWTHRLFAGIRDFAITTICLALVYVLLWLAFIAIHALEIGLCLFSELSPVNSGTVRLASAVRPRRG